MSRHVAAGDHHRAGLGQSLQSRGQVGRLADHPALLGLALADEITDHHEAGGDADATSSGSRASMRRTAATTATPARTVRSASSSWARG
jgi:hypothetical protein